MAERQTDRDREQRKTDRQTSKLVSVGFTNEQRDSHVA